MIAAVVQKATGRKLDQYARDVLFAPLGIDDSEWIAYPDGNPIAASGLRLRPRDVAKIGSLYLSAGRWNGRQVAPADWLRTSIEPRVDTGAGARYGYQWWLGSTPLRDRTVPLAVGMGNGGQRLFVISDLDLVVVITAGTYNDPAQGRATADIILNQHVLPAVRDSR